MNKNIWLLFIVCLGLLKCTNQSKVNQSFHCKTSRFEQLEKLRDVKKLFSIELPKTWNTNFYYDTLQSSIYTADTTKQLTETFGYRYLPDATKKIVFHSQDPFLH